VRATVAKRLRKAIFGTDFSPRARTYRHHPRIPGVRFADERRQAYQALKRRFQRREFVL
jgi:hypothetical protein